MSTQVGVTLYNLREYCKTEDGLRKSLELFTEIDKSNLSGDSLLYEFIKK